MPVVLAMLEFPPCGRSAHRHSKRDPFIRLATWEFGKLGR